MGKVNTLSLIYCMKDDWENWHNPRHTFLILDTHIDTICYLPIYLSIPTCSSPVPTGWLYLLVIQCNLLGISWPRDHWFHQQGSKCRCLESYSSYPVIDILHKYNMIQYSPQHSWPTGIFGKSNMQVLIWNMCDNPAGLLASRQWVWPFGWVG